MKVHQHTVEIERQGIDQNDDGAFSIEFNDKAASILADGLYKDKPLAIVRELCCNARDSMVDAGKGDQPFRVHLPNQLEPWFSVEDDGLGMSQEFAMKTFTRFFSSTKTNSNNTIGQLGLGSKSPFSMVDSYVVETRYDGVLTTWAAYRGETGIPRFAKMSESPTDRPNGVLINLAVPTSRFREFYSSAKNVLSRFNPMPVITGMDTEILPISYSMKTEIYGVRENSSSSVFSAVMGGVAYPIDCNILHISSHQWSNIDLFFDIGDLEVIASREGLQYTDRVKKLILERTEAVEKDCVEYATAEVDSAATLYEAIARYNDLPQFIRVFARNILFTTKGRQYDATQQSINLQPRMKQLCDHIDLETFDLRYTTRVTRRPWSSYHRIKIMPSNTVVILNDLDSKDRSLSKRVQNAYGRNTVLVVTPTTKSGIARFLVAAGRAPISMLVKASTLEKPPSNSQKKTNVFSLTVGNNGYSFLNTDFVPTTLKFSEVKTYVRVSNYRVLDSRGDYIHEEKNLIRQIEKCFPGSTKDLVAVRNGDTRYLSPSAVELFSFVTTEFAKKYATEIQKDIVCTALSSLANRGDGIRALMRDVYKIHEVAAGTGLEELIPEVCEASKKLKSNKSIPSDFSRIFELTKNTMSSTTVVGFDPQVVTDKLEKAYPMLPYISFSGCYQNSTQKNQNIVLDYIKAVDASRMIP